VPVEVVGLPTIVAIAESDDTDVAIAANGTVWGWGWNESGQLCTGDTVEQDTPVQLTALPPITLAAGAGPHMLYLTTAGALVACGANGQGELGDGTFTGDTFPVDVTGLPDSPVVSLSAGPRSSTALLANGQVWDWGFNRYGELGDGNTHSTDVPVQVQLPGPAKAVSQGGDTLQNGQSLALLASGTVWAWGCDRSGQAGTGTVRRYYKVPVQVAGLPTTITAIASGGDNSLALDATGDVTAWGGNANGESGTGTRSKMILTPVVILSGVRMISATADDVVAEVRKPKTT
jgi:alpha-tubulin suppressor-like RCC1 family protein